MKCLNLFKWEIHEVNIRKESNFDAISVSFVLLWSTVQQGFSVRNWVLVTRSALQVSLLIRLNTEGFGRCRCRV